MEKKAGEIKISKRGHKLYQEEGALKKGAGTPLWTMSMSNGSWWILHTQLSKKVSSKKIKEGNKVSRKNDVIQLKSILL